MNRFGRYSVKTHSINLYNNLLNSFNNVLPILHHLYNNNGNMGTFLRRQNPLLQNQWERVLYIINQITSNHDVTIFLINEYQPFAIAHMNYLVEGRLNSNKLIDYIFRELY